jgi:hypothetical protein
VFPEFDLDRNEKYFGQKIGGKIAFFVQDFAKIGSQDRFLRKTPKIRQKGQKM